MNEARYLALKCEQMVWTRHTDAVFGTRAVAKDEIVKITWANGFTCPPQPAGDCNWGHLVGDKQNPIVSYETCEPRFPELCKETEAKARGSMQIGEFLDWLGEQNIVLAEYNDRDQLQVADRPRGKHQFLAEFFGIDVVKAETERQQLLDEFVKSQQGAAQ